MLMSVDQDATQGYWVSAMDAFSHMILKFFCMIDTPEKVLFKTLIRGFDL